MADNREIRRLQAKWNQGTGWPLRLEWIEISGVRGWQRQRFDLKFPIMAVVGENGAGKSTILQAAATMYRPPGPSTLKGRYASDFFPDTTWDRIHAAEIRGSVREGAARHTTSVRKPADRWRGNPERRERHVEYIDLSRVQPVSARVGYARLANPTLTETSANPFGKTRLKRFCEILGRGYDEVKLSLTSGDSTREVPVISIDGEKYSGFHQGAGETTLVQLLTKDIPPKSLVLIDEIESSLHPRMQRRLIRDLAELCRVLELQVVLTTHSPYILEELPPEGRAHIVLAGGRREIVYGVSPEFAMTRMDDVPHHECDLYVEDDHAGAMLTEILAAHSPGVVQRCQLIPYGAAEVGKSLGQMIAGRRFKRPSCVFLDGDKSEVVGCLLLPGEDAPERVVFDALQGERWANLHHRTGRSYADVADACSKAMLLGNHHDWVQHTATSLVLGGDMLWQAMCAEWATGCLSGDDASAITQPVEDALTFGMSTTHQIVRPPSILPGHAADNAVADTEPPTLAPDSPTAPGRLFERWPGVPRD